MSIYIIAERVLFFFYYREDIISVTASFIGKDLIQQY